MASGNSERRDENRTQQRLRKNSHEIHYLTAARTSEVLPAIPQKQPRPAHHPAAAWYPRSLANLGGTTTIESDTQPHKKS